MTKSQQNVKNEKYRLSDGEDVDKTENNEKKRINKKTANVV